jgi:hypothetical protein
LLLVRDIPRKRRDEAGAPPTVQRPHGLTMPRGMTRSGHVVAMPANGSRSVPDPIDWATLPNRPSHSL